jgi:hypothetical protein
MPDNSWPGQQYGGPYPTMNYPPTANLPHSAYHSGYIPRADPPLYGGAAYYTGHVPVEPAPARPSSHWPLVVVAVVMSGVLLGGVAVYHAIQVGRRWAVGDVHGAGKASRLAKTWSIAAITVGALVTAAAVAVVSVTGPPALGYIGTTSSQLPLDVAPVPPTTPGLVDPTLERPAGLNSIQTVFFDQLQSDLQLAADRLGRGEDPTFQCVSVLVTAGTYESSFAGAATKAQEQCGREIPLAWVGHELDSAAAKGDPIDAIMECAMAKVSLDSVEEHFTDPRVGELRARSDQVCG